MSQKNMTQEQMTESFWQWSCQVYQQQDVGKICLSVQDELNLNVNYLLLAIWSEENDYQVLEELWADIHKHGQDAQNAVLHIRNKRHQLKDRSESAYQQALLIELKAEKIVQKLAMQVLFKKKMAFSKKEKKQQNLVNYLNYQKVEKEHQTVVLQLGQLVQSLAF